MAGSSFCRNSSSYPVDGDRRSDQKAKPNTSIATTKTKARVPKGRSPIGTLRPITQPSAVDRDQYGNGGKAMITEVTAAKGHFQTGANHETTKHATKRINTISKLSVAPIPQANTGMRGGVNDATVHARSTRTRITKGLVGFIDVPLVRGVPDVVDVIAEIWRVLPVTPSLSNRDRFAIHRAS